MERVWVVELCTVHITKGLEYCERKLPGGRW